MRQALVTLGEQLGGDVGAELTETARAVRIIERTWASRLPLAVQGCDDLAALLGEVAPGEVVSPGDDPLAGPAGLAEAEAAHEAMRASLARLIRESGDDDAGVALRCRATACLRAATARRPW